MTRWRLRGAKNRLSKARKARDRASRAKPNESLVAFLRKSPLAGMALEVRRSRDTGRDQ